MFGLKKWNRLVFVVLCGAVFVVVGFGVLRFLEPGPAFSREQAIARAREIASQSRPEVGMVQARIDEITAELMSMSDAYKRAGIDSILSSDPQVWLVTVHGNFVYEGYPMPEARQFYRSTRQMFIMNAETGAMDTSGVVDTQLIGATPRAPQATPTLIP